MNQCEKISMKETTMNILLRGELNEMCPIPQILVNLNGRCHRLQTCVRVVVIDTTGLTALMSTTNGEMQIDHNQPH